MRVPSISLPDHLYFDRLMSGRPLTKAQYRQVVNSTLLTTPEREQAAAKHHELLLHWLYDRAFKAGDLSRWAHGHIAIHPSFSDEDRQTLRDAIGRGDIRVDGMPRYQWPSQPTPTATPPATDERGRPSL